MDINNLDIVTIANLRSDEAQRDIVKNLEHEELSRLLPYLVSIINQTPGVNSLTEQVKPLQLDTDKAVIVIDAELTNDETSVQLRKIKNACFDYFTDHLSVLNNKSLSQAWEFTIEREHLIISFATITEECCFESALELLSNLLPDAKHPNPEPNYDIEDVQAQEDFFDLDFSTSSEGSKSDLSVLAINDLSHLINIPTALRRLVFSPQEA